MLSPLSPQSVSSSQPVEKTVVTKKTKKSARTLNTLFPRIPKTATTLLEEFLRRESRLSLYFNPMLTFARDQVCLHAEDCLLKLRKQVITYQDVRNMVENLIGLHKMCFKREPETAKPLALTLRKLIIIVGEVASSLEKLSDVPVTDWVGVGEELVKKHDKVSVLPQPPFWAFIPKMRDFESIKILGSGGFGVVHLASYKPASLMTTVKLVNMERFTRQKQAAMDKIIASVVSNPFIVKYYCCFVCKAYVTVMEYVPGVDLMRVVNHEHFLDIEAVKVIMAQLILALEHMHLRGFLHRDIKVSNMLLMPGGRLKLIDFDTSKVCHGLFSIRTMRTFFKKTPFEFNDAESAGTVPYMAPEVLRRRPYGRAVDWWAAGIVMYKLMTGRVPFRGKTKQALRDRIITSPLRWPRPEERENSATTPAKDMTFRLLRKNAVDRLGSRSYADLKSHPFFDRFNWKRLRHDQHLCDIPSLVPLVRSMRSRDMLDSTSAADRRRLLKLGELKDVSADNQRPLLCYASDSFKKLIIAVERAAEPIALSDSFMDTSSDSEPEMSYVHSEPPPPISEDRPSVFSPDGGATPVSVLVGVEKIDIMLYRKKRYSKYWNFGFELQRLKGEDNINYFVVHDVKPDSPAEKSQLLVLDFLLKVNGETVLDLPMGRVKTLIATSGDQMLLTVIAPRETVVLCPVRATCALQKRYGVELLEPDVWDDRGKQFVKVYVVKDMVSPNDNNAVRAYLAL